MKKTRNMVQMVLLSIKKNYLESTNNQKLKLKIGTSLGCKRILRTS
jgi:hypothetical protein